MVDVDVNGVGIEGDLKSEVYVTRHTSHVTRHTSHITRHTSHITHLRKQSASVQMQHMYARSNADGDNVGMPSMTLLQLHSGAVLVGLDVQVGVLNLKRKGV